MYGATRRPPGNAPLSDEDLIKLRYGEHLEIAKVFPPAFTLACCLLFVVPTAGLILILRNPITAYFQSKACYILMVIPVLVLISHIIHSRKKAPSKEALVIALIVPCLLLLVFGQLTMIHALHMYSTLFSTDCFATTSKASLQQSWEAAYSTFQRCINQTKAEGLSSDALMNTFRLPDCSEYTTAAGDYSKDWKYLQYLEETQSCSGWCYPAQQLWSVATYSDSCSVTVASFYDFFVLPYSKEIAIVMVVTLVASSTLLIFLGPKMRKLGISGW